MSLRELDSETGIDYAHLKRMEDGGVNPTISTLYILADALQVDPCQLL